MKKVLIIGGSGGLGRAIIKRLKHRANTVNVSREASGADRDIRVDLRKRGDVLRALGQLKKFDFDTIICCSGILHWHKTGTIPSDEIDADFAVNVTGPLKLIDGLVPQLRKNHGDLLIVGSTSSFVCYPDSAVYQAAKHGMLGYIKSLQAELKKEDVRVIGFYPGGFDSGFHDKAKSPILKKDLMRTDDVADLLLHVLSLPRSMQVSEMIIDRKTIT
ncbi:MAG: SDR family oxidoreductase [Nanoarchaeota archaeon]